MADAAEDDWALIWRHFDRLADRPRVEQAKLLAQAGLPQRCRDTLNKLLAGHHDDGVLDGTLAPEAEPVVADPPALPPDALIGSFRVERLIGRGGMGEVYLAQRAAGGFGQTVAVKLMRAEAGRHLAAFERERALQAGFEHPGIARLIDGGATPDGRPWMALEHVEGEAITAWCAAHRVDLRTRLSLLLQVCDAVNYAHARLVVHCDLKPSNILVTREGRVKLVDFGIAQVVSQTRDPEAVGELGLTPIYAAPEQLEAAPPTVATDVYALGCVLAELLTGAPPWEQRPGGLPVLVRRLQGSGPTRPSNVARSVRDAPVHAGLIAGDLDAVVARATQQRPEQRYPGVGALAADIRAHLDRRPIAARPAPWTRRARLFVQRHYLGSAAAALALLATAGGIAGTAWQAQRATAERDLARDRAARLESTNQVLLLMFRDAGGDADMRSISVRDMLASASSRLLRSLPPDSPDAAPSVAALADIYLIIESNADARYLLEQALARGVGKGDPASRARLQLKLGAVLAIAGDVTGATRLVDAAAQEWQTDPQRFRIERAETAGIRSLVLRRQGRTAAAIALLRQNLPEAQDAFHDDRDLAVRYASLASLLADAGRLAEADRVLAEAVRGLGRSGAPLGSALLNLQRMRADLAARAGDPGKAERLLTATIAQRQRYYGPSLALAVDLLHRARLFSQEGRFAPALAELDRAAPMMDEHFGAQSGPSVQVRLARTYALAMAGDRAQAAALLASIDPKPLLDGPGAGGARYLYAQAAITLAQGRAEAARPILMQADAMAAKGGTAALSARREATVLRRRLG